MLSKQRPSEIALEIQRGQRAFFFLKFEREDFFKKVSVFFMFTCVQYSFPFFDWLCLCVGTSGSFNLICFKENISKSSNKSFDVLPLVTSFCAHVLQF